MEYNIEYSVNDSDLLKEFKRTVSLVASQGVNQDGSSIYDSSRFYERNEAEALRYIRDGVRSFVARFSDVTRLEMGVDGVPYQISFYLPDFNVTAFESVGSLIDKFIHDKAVSLWFTNRAPDSAKFYAESAIGTLAEIAIILRTRKNPERS